MNAWTRKWCAPWVVVAASAMLSGPAGAAALGTRDYTPVDRHALAAPAAAERSLDSLAAWLGGAPARDEAERARAIYRWITDRIAYDAGAYFSGRFRNTQRAPEDVLRQRRAVCDGYAGLFEALARRVGRVRSAAPRPGRAPPPMSRGRTSPISRAICPSSSRCQSSPPGSEPSRSTATRRKSASTAV